MDMDKFLKRGLWKVVVLLLIKPAYESGSLPVQIGISVILGAIILLGLYGLIEEWLHRLSIKRIKKAVDHWRAGETGEAIHVLNNTKHPLTEKLLHWIHAGKDGNDIQLTFRTGEKY